MQDQDLMQRALNLAEKARGKTSPNPMVGAVIVKDGEIIGEGFHLKAGTPHAEVHALRQAGENAKGATMYVTLEPCSHYGRTPPCADAIIASGITRVVAAMEDPNPKVSGNGFNKLKAAGIEVEIGILEQQAKELNEVFIHNITTGLPFVALKTAATLDGMVATSNRLSKWITSLEARKHVHLLRDRYDAVLTGIGTVLADDPELTVRYIETEKQPIRLVLDSELKIPLQAKILNNDSKTIIITSQKADQAKEAALQSRGIEILKLGLEGKHIDLADTLNLLGKRGLTSIMIEAGPTLVTSFLQQGKVDKWYHFAAAKLFGQGAYTFYQQESVTAPEQALNFKITEVHTIGEDILLTMYPKRGEEI